MTDMPPIEYWLPWWWDYPESIPVTPLHPAAKPAQGGGVQPSPTPPSAAAVTATPPTFGFGGGGSPPPAAGAAAVAVEAEELKRLKERNSQVFNR